MNERRKHFRLRFELTVELQDEVGHRASKVRDISEGGVFLVTPTPIRVGSEVRLGLTLDHEHIVAIGVVARQGVASDGEHEGVGLEFTSLSPHARTVLRRFIARRRATDYAVASRRRAPRPPHRPHGA